MTATDRARSYLAACPGAGAGDRDNTAIATACKLVERFDLPEGDLADLLLEWNTAANTPPMTEREVRKCLRSALERTGYDPALANGTGSPPARRTDRKPARPPQEEPAQPLPDAETWQQLRSQLTDGAGEAAQKAREYLSQLGIDPATCGWGLGKLTAAEAASHGLPKAAAGVRYLLPVCDPVTGALADVRRYAGGPFGEGIEPGAKLLPWAKGYGQAKPYRFGPETAGAAVVWTEGEKDCEAGRAAGLPAVSNTCGAGSARRVAESLPAEVLPAEVTTLFDADEAGDKGAAGLAEALAARGVPVKVATWPPDAPDGYDVADALRDGYTADDLRALLEAATPYTPPAPEPTAAELVTELVDTVTAAEPGDRPQLVTAALASGIAEALAELLETDPGGAEAARGKLRDAMPRNEVGRATGLFDAATKLLQAKRQAERDARRQAVAVAAEERRHQDLALAEAFAEAHRGQWLPAAGRQWYRYTDGVWVKRDDDELRGILWRFIDAESPDGANKRAVDSVYDAVATLTGWRADDRALNANPMLVNVRNGVYDLETGKLLPHDPDLLQTVQRPFEYDPEATCPRWNQFLAEALVTTDGTPDPALASLLQEFFGYCLVPDARAHKACVWTGEGSNGKGVATGILTALVGEENTVGTDIAKLDDDYKRADLRDKLLAVSSEVPSRALVADATFKAVVSGDLLSARLPYAPPFSFRPYARILITCNDLPATSDRTWGFYRRLIIMPWNARFDGDAVNPDLEAELREAELPGIFRWAVNGLARLLQQGWKFTPADAAARALEEYRLEGNSVALWVAERVELVEGNRVASSELYADYRDYCEAGNLHAFGISQFPRKLRGVLPDIAEAPDRYGKGWSGLDLLPRDPYLASRKAR